MPKIFALALESFLIGAFGAGNRMTPHAFHTLEKFGYFLVMLTFSKRNCVLKGLKFFRDPKKILT